MKALWMKYFHISDDVPISEKVFSARFALNICLILVYLFCMTYAAIVLFQSTQVLSI